MSYIVVIRKSYECLFACAHFPIIETPISFIQFFINILFQHVLVYVFVCVYVFR